MWWARGEGWAVSCRFVWDLENIQQLKSGAFVWLFLRVQVLVKVWGDSCCSKGEGAVGRGAIFCYIFSTIISYPCNRLAVFDWSSLSLFFIFLSKKLPVIVLFWATKWKLHIDAWHNQDHSHQLAIRSVLVGNNHLCQFLFDQLIVRGRCLERYKPCLFAWLNLFSITTTLLPGLDFRTQDVALLGPFHCAS